MMAKAGYFYVFLPRPEGRGNYKFPVVAFNKGDDRCDFK
jgi:hypothetical protein